MAAGAAPLLTAVLLLQTVAAFNLDTQHYTRHGTADQASMFGFTVAAHRYGQEIWVMVGAPEAQTQQQYVRRGGAVYRCPPSSEEPCTQIIFDREGNKNYSGIQADHKSYQWFGATLNSGGADGPLVACAPRYYVMDERKAHFDPVGTCFVASRDLTRAHEYSPCRTRNWGYHRQGVCQAGFGAAMSKNGDRMYIGAPGSWYWQGQMYSVNPAADFPFMPQRYRQFGEGQLYSHGLDEKPNVLFTREGNPRYDDQYLGYSVAVGDFRGNTNDQQDVAVGVPRGDNLMGKVALFTWDLRNLRNFTGQQVGEYFGYCIATGDVDGDGLDDLLVGSPMYTTPNNEGKYDTGRVYIFYQNSEKGWFERNDTLDGAVSKGRFGLSLVALGDVNMDGFGDFAVGAPYDGAFGSGGLGQGAVYIFHGGAGGVNKKYAQVIKAEELFPGTVSTFGFSLAGGVDLDNNRYNDLIVGAYETNNAFVFRAKPVVRVTGRVVLGEESRLISLTDLNCTLRNRDKVFCSSMEYCLSYDGVGVDTQDDFELQILLDSKKKNDPRLFFSDYEGRHSFNESVTLSRGNPKCRSVQVYLKPNLRDKLTPIEVEVRYSMRGRRTSGAFGRNPRAVLQPVLDETALNYLRDTNHIQNNCGSDNVCIPNLKLIATPNVEKFLLGSKDLLIIDVIVQNSGEDSFESTYYLQLPAGVNYKKVERQGGEVAVQCSAPTIYNNNTLKCDIGNPLPQGQLVHFKVLLEPYHKMGMAPVYDLFMEANSSNPEVSGNLADNQQRMGIAIWLETDLGVTGVSSPPELHFNVSQYREGNITHEADFGYQVVHKYRIRNNGPSTIDEAEVFVVWPYETLAGDSLMYLLEQPETTGNIQCELAEHINDWNLQIDRKRKSYIDAGNDALQGGMIASGGGAVISGGGGSMTTYEENSWRKEGHVITEEQKKKIDEEEKKFDTHTGDASQVHIIRAQQAKNQQEQHGGGNIHVQQGTLLGNRTHSTVHHTWDSGPSGTSVTSDQSFRGTETVTQGGRVRVTGDGHRTGGTVQGEKQVWVSKDGREGYWTSEESARTLGINTWNAATGRQRVWVSDGAQGGHWSYSSQTVQGGQGQTQFSGTQNNRDNFGIVHSNTNTYGGTYGSRDNYGGMHDNRDNVNRNRDSYGSTQGNRDNHGGAHSNREHWAAIGGAGGAGGYNKTYTQTWNSSWVGSGPAVVHHYSHNSSAETGLDGQVRRTETSTEYYTVGQEGEATSSFNNRIGGVNTHQGRTGYEYKGGQFQAGSSNQGGQFQAGSSNQGGQLYTGVSNLGSQFQAGSSNQDGQFQAGVSGQGGSTRYGSGSYTSGGARYVPDPRYSGGYTTSFNKSYGYDDMGGEVDTQRRHKWSTEETVNQDLYRAGSQTFAGVEGRGLAEAAAGGKGFRVNTWGVRTEGSAPSTHTKIQEVPYPYEASSERGRDNVATDKPTEHFRWDRGARSRRQASSPVMDHNDAMLEEATRCPGLRCARVRCVAGPMPTNHEIWIAIRTRVNVQTLKKLSFGRAVTLTSVGVARVSRLPYLGTPQERTPHSQQAITKLMAVPEPQAAEGIPLWAVVLAACAGAALLLLLILALYKCGFFKRNRPSDAPERQPLNRNGYGHGDEQL